MQTEQEYVYDAFISYSHRDLKWARWLQRRLETFRVPRGIGTQQGAHRRLRVFRDQTDLAGVELQMALQRELEASRYLIVICSPSSAASHWVNDEIRFFYDRDRKKFVIPFIVDGEPESDDPARECYPPALRSEADRHPLGASVPEIGKNKAFLKLMSILLDVRFNRLVDREKQRRRRTWLSAGAVSAAFLSFASVLLLRNARISRENEVLSYDIYGAALLSISQKDVIEPSDVAFLRTSAEEGNSEAAWFLASCLKNGWGTEQNPEEAVFWFTKAAEQEDVDAMLALANCYSEGTGVAKDLEQAFAWELRAAEQGNAGAMLQVAIDYEEGLGVGQDEKQAFDWYTKAAESGDELAMYNLAGCYLRGYGTEASQQNAFFWMEKLAESGNTLGMYNLGMMYQYGFGTEEDARKAYLWYRKAADAGDADAMYSLAWCIENRYGTDDQALEWYRLAAEKGHAEAAAAAQRLEEQLREAAPEDAASPDTKPQ